MSLNDTEPSLCAKGCGFFGRPENKNLCSKCYKDYIKEEAVKHLAALKIKGVPTEKSPDCSSTSTVKEQEAVPTTAGGGGGGEVKRRCNMCNRKVGLLGFDCRCGHVYCKLHRYPEEHSCPSNYQRKKAQIEALVKQNPLVKADKLEGRIL